MQEADIQKRTVFCCPTCKKRKEPVYCQSCVDWLLKEAHRDDKREINDLKKRLEKEPEKENKVLELNNGDGVIIMASGEKEPEKEAEKNG